ncbi:class I SAM-dependent methyltransferase [Litoribacter populi]|uniref:class I SAM-dependent methyltransferase n=1 Tax=Litoribacter populi TaxID=2598460 RepID=UPI00117C734D|nr:class I SAM-dependent methyltransferase [Litoribacter populi]
MASKYIHGYQEVEQERLVEQAQVIENQIFDYIDFFQVNQLLEIGSGVGAQTEILLKRFPHLAITGVEYESKQIEKAYKNLEKHGFDTDKVEFVHQDATRLDLKKEYDGAFICWVLEHVEDPLAILKTMKPCLIEGALVVVTEVFNSTFYTYPERKEVQDYWKIYNDYQIRIGGDPEVGAKLGNLLSDAGYQDIQLRSGGFHLDKREAEQKRKVFTYWKNLMSSGAPNLIEENLLTEKEVLAMQKAMDELRDQADSVFFYRFIQATACR